MNPFPDIAQIERENRRLARDRREEERVNHVRRLGMENQERVAEEVPLEEGPNNEQNVEQEVNQGPGPNNGNGHGGVHRRPPQVLRPIGAYDEPNARELSLGIIPPVIPLNNFELKASMLSMVERSTFKGNAIECPLEHLGRFERLCRTLKVNGIPEDTVRMMLFPFSLEDKAAYWEKTIPSHLVANWAAVKTEFLRKFFPKQKTAKFRNDIQSFTQRGDESMSEAWDRLKGYTRSCPHHGVTKENLLGIFYRGVLNEIRRALDTASYGSFASLDVEQAELLIENLAQSDACFGGDYDRTLRGNSSSVSNVDAKIEKLNERFDKLSKLLMGNQKQVAFMDNTQDVYQDCSQGVYQENYQGYGNEEYVESQEEVNYLSNQGNYNNSFKPFNNSHPNLSYRSPNVENPQDQVYPNQQQGFQPKQFNNTQARPTQGFNQPRPNFNQQGNFQPKGNFQSNFQPRAPNFQTQAAAPTQPSQDLDIKTMFQTIMEGQVKGQRETEKRFKEMQLQVDQVTANVRSLESRVAQVASSSKPPTGTFPGKVETNPKSPCNAVLESCDEPLVDVTQLRIAKESDEVKKVIAKSESSKDEQTLKKKYEDPKEKFLKIVALVEEEERLEREALGTSREASTFRGPQKLKTLHKREDPGKFNIPVCLGGREFEDALCDSGSYANVISWDLVQELGIKGMSPHPKPLTFGDASTKVPKGIIEKFPIMVGDCEVESDLLVVDMVDSKKQPILLGAPFLLTTGAVIDYVKNEMILKNVDELVRYSITSPQESSGTIIKDKAFFEPHGVFTTEAISHPDLDEFITEMKLKVEVPSQEEATSRAIKDKLGTEFKELGVDYVTKEMKGFGNEVPSREEATLQAVDPTPAIEGNVFKIEQIFTKMKLENEAPLPKEAASQAAEGASKEGNEMVKDAKGTKRTKPKRDQNAPHEPHPPSFILPPLSLFYGMPDCTNGYGRIHDYSNPSLAARFFHNSTSASDHTFGTANDTMTNRFGFLLDDPGPLQYGPSPVKN